MEVQQFDPLDIYKRAESSILATVAIDNMAEAFELAKRTGELFILTGCEFADGVATIRLGPPPPRMTFVIRQSEGSDD